MSAKFTIGALSDLKSQPLFHTLKSSSDTPGELSFDTPATHIERLMSKEMDAAFISPMDYAVNSSDLIMLPTIGVSSSGFSNVTRLYFRDNVKAISSMAVGAVSTIDVVATRLVLGEKYDAAPAIVPVQGSIDDMLAKADCALVAGDVVLSSTSLRPHIDIVDEWSDITELPFVHTIAVMRNESLNKELSDLLVDAQHRGRLSLELISNELSKTTHLSNEIIYSFLSHLSYGLDDESKQSLEEFFRMAYYYGMLTDIPEINIAV